MDAYLHSLIAYAIVVNIIAIPLILLGRKFGLRCHPFEYVVLYLCWGVFVLLVGSVFNDLNDAMVQLDVSNGALNAIFGVAGFLAGLSLLPKILFANKGANSTLLTSLTSVCISVIYAKFAVIAFLFTS